MLRESEAALAKGDYAASLKRSDQAAKCFARAADLAGEASAINQTGLAYLYRGDYDRALANFQAALAFDERSGDNSQLVAHLNNLGNVYFFQGAYYSALEYYRRALSAANAHPAESGAARRLALTSLNLAVLYEQIGQNRTALRYFKETQRNSSALQPVEYGQLLSNLGTLYRRLGDPAAAISNYREAQRIFAQAQNADSEIHVLENIGIAFGIDLHDYEQAIAFFSRALTLADRDSNKRQMLLAHLFRGEAFYRRGDNGQSAQDFQATLIGAQQIHASEEQWTALFGLGRLQSRSGDRKSAQASFAAAIQIIEGMRSGLHASALRTEFLGNKRDVYDALIELLVEQPSIDQERIFTLAEQARERTLRDVFRTELNPSLSSVRGMLRSGDMLLEYWLGRDNLAVFAITRASSNVYVTSVTPQERESIERFTAVIQSDSDQTWKADSKALGKLLLRDLDRETRVSHLFVVPDGTLNELPFEALDTGKGLLIERFDVNYLPSASVLRAPKQTPLFSAPWRLQLAAFADPIPLHDPLPGVADEYWRPLPFSREEANSVARLIPGRTKLYLGTHNLKRMFLASANEKIAVLHLSTHGSVDTSDPERSRIVFSPERGKAGSEYLFLKEVASLKLTQTDLVTLSACDTERGKSTPGEGLHTFSRALLGAGARATVTTLWRVADQATAEFMKQFYLHLARGDSKANALRKAKLSFLRSGNELAQPRYWAAFVLNGEGRTPIPYSDRGKWIQIAIALAVSAGLSILVAFFRKSRARKLAGLNQ